jgi:hypothetical protein
VVLITAAAVIAIVRKIPGLPVREYLGSNLSLPTREEHAQSNANNEDHIHSGGAIARAVTRDANDGSGAKPQKWH